MSNKIRSLKDDSLGPLKELIRLLEFENYFNGDLFIEGEEPLLKSPHKLADATAFALLLEAVAASSIWQLKKPEKISAKVSLTDAIHALHSTHFLWQSGFSLSVGAEYIPTNGLFLCRDGRYIMTESGPPYIKLERGYLDFFDCGNNKTSLQREIAKFDSEDLQMKLSELGLPACIAYTKDEWRNHQQGQILTNTPVIEIEKIADGPKKGLENISQHPLDGIKVLDFTHVLAGPRSARTLAQYGAQVLHISSPYHRDYLSQNLLVNMGKEQAFLLLDKPENLETMKKLVSETDVFCFSYRPTVANKFTLTPRDLVEQNDSFIYLSINCYGHAGPWKDRPGFDQNGQVATGFTMTEGAAKTQEINPNNIIPQFSPVFYLNDFLTAYLASSGVMRALLKRATEGGSYHVKVSLARSAMWVQDLGFNDPEKFNLAPEKDIYPANLHNVDTAFGKITELLPAAKFIGTDLRKNLSPVRPFGADNPCWH